MSGPPQETDHRRHIYEGEPDEDLIEFLEPDQLVVEMDRPVPRREFGVRMRIALWALRVLVLVMAAMVVYIFAAGLGRS